MKLKNKAVSIILSTAMIPVILPVGVFQSSQVCHAVEIISVNDAIAELANPGLDHVRRKNLMHAFSQYCLSRNISDIRCFIILKLKEYIRSKGQYIDYAKQWCKQLNIIVRTGIMEEQPNFTPVSLDWDEFSDDVLRNRMYTHDTDPGIVPVGFNGEDTQQNDIQIVD